jgi:hypothetical protein
VESEEPENIPSVRDFSPIFPDFSRGLFGLMLLCLWSLQTIALGFPMKPRILPGGRVPDFGYGLPKAAAIRVLWAFSFVALALFLAFYMWACVSALELGRDHANELVTRFHQELNNSQYRAICEEADQDLRNECIQVARSLQSVHSKLGDAVRSNLTTMNVNAGVGGTFVVAEYDTSFTHGTAIETFTWIKRGNGLKLYGYNPHSFNPHSSMIDIN